MGTFCDADVLGRVRRVLLDLRSPVWISDHAVFRQLLLAGRGDRLEERASGPLDAHKKVRSKETFVEHAAPVLAEVVVLPRLEHAIALKQRPGNERHLLRVEVRSWVLMREVDTVVA